MRKQAKKVIINDPIYGTIDLPYPILLSCINHPYFQRLRGIQQSGLASFVFPGATHTRFSHSIGAMHLMNKAILSLKQKGVAITEKEREAAMLAILLHDVGHGPFSHALEFSLVKGVSHEEISSLIFTRLNTIFEGKLQLAQEIFNFQHPKRFLCQMVASQLDMDRLDYLQRDSFYSGVAEASIGAVRLIEALEVKKGRLCINEKAIYSLEQFLLARKIMYLQVYMHKSVIGLEGLLVRALKRAKELVQKGEKITASPALHFFLKEEIGLEDFHKNQQILEDFFTLDDAQIWVAIRSWAQHPDYILSQLSSQILHRELQKVEVSATPFSLAYIESIREKIQKKYAIQADEVFYFLVQRTENFSVYNPKDGLYILQKNGKLAELYQKGHEMGLSITEKMVTKHFLGYPRIL